MLNADDWATRLLDDHLKSGWKRKRLHYEVVTALATSLFDQLSGKHKLDAHWRELLRLAGMLHDIGTHGRYDDTRHGPPFHRHKKPHGWISADIILDSSTGCPPADAMIIATVVSLHSIEDERTPESVEDARHRKGVGPIYRRIADKWDNQEIPDSVLDLVAILRVADGFDRSLVAAVKGVQIREGFIWADPPQQYCIEAAASKEELLKERFQVQVLQGR